MFGGGTLLAYFCPMFAYVESAKLKQCSPNLGPYVTSDKCYVCLCGGSLGPISHSVYASLRPRWAMLSAYWAMLGACWAHAELRWRRCWPMLVGLCCPYVGCMLALGWPVGPCWPYVEPSWQLCWDYVGHI